MSLKTIVDEFACNSYLKMVKGISASIKANEWISQKKNWKSLIKLIEHNLFKKKDFALFNFYNLFFNVKG